MSLESRAARLIAEHGGADALSITEFYSRVDRALRTAFPDELWITGEIRSMKVLPRGHCFIDLVDPDQRPGRGAPTLNAKCWSTQWRSVRSTLDRLGITLDAGMVVRARGEVQFYKARGTVDFILREIDTDALLGKVAAERARLVKALVDENLFDRQRRLPRARRCRSGSAWWPAPAPRGTTTSSAGSGTRGWPSTSRWPRPPSRAGRPLPGWPRPSRRAAGRAARRDRGGAGRGSKADLAAFDQEPVARAIATSDVPVWTGIGHTGDQSVADEVANRSFITPTECGQELARLAARVLADRGGRGGGPGPAGTRPGRRQPTGSWRPGSGPCPSGPGPSSSATPTGLGHRARTLRGVARGQLDTHGHRLAYPGEVLVGRGARPGGGARRPLRPGRSPGRAAREVGWPSELARRRSGGGSSEPTTTSASSNGATRSPGTPSGRVVRSVDEIRAGSLLRTDSPTVSWSPPR